MCLFAFLSSEATAQNQRDLVDLIAETYYDGQARLFDSIGNSQIIDFDEGALFPLASEFNFLMVLETAAFPIGSSSGGFTYLFDTTSGAALRSSPSFGPAFAERPLTSGRGKLTVGTTFMHRSFSKLEGLDLDGSSLKIYTPINYVGTSLLADVEESTLNLNVTTDTTTLFATYGVMDRLDVSVAVPIQRIKMDVDFSSQLLRFGPRSGFACCQVPVAQASRSGSASGVGDVAIRAKYNFLNRENGAVAAGLDMRLPTGDETNLLGTGRTRTKLYAALSSNLPGSRMARFFPHANFGYTFESEANDDDLFFFGSEFSYAAGAEYVAHPRLTVVGDIFGRSLADEGRLQQQSQSFQLAPTISPSLPAETRTVTGLAFEPGLRLNSTLASIGAKFNPFSTFIISAHALFQLTDAGIASDVTPVIGFDYSF
jgi:hypothetical protein